LWLIPACPWLRRVTVLYFEDTLVVIVPKMSPKLLLRFG
jgi:hypothetical protein